MNLKLYSLIVLIFAGILTLGNEKISSISWGKVQKMNPDNGSFEKTQNNKAAMWFINKGIYPRGTIIIKGNSSQEGANCVQIVNGQNQRSHYYSGTAIKVDGGETVCFSAFVKGKGTFKIAAYAYNSSNRMINYPQPEFVKINSSEWSEKKFKFSIPAKSNPETGKIVRINPVIIIEPESTIYIDNVRGTITGGKISKGDVKIIQGANNDPKPEKKGEAPYEMARRQETRKPFMTFYDCSKWAVECFNAKAALYRTNEQFLPFREWCGKLVYQSIGDNPYVIVRPLKPVIIQGVWDCVNMWNWGSAWGWLPDSPKNPFVKCSVLIRGANGDEHEIKLHGMAYKYWFLTHRKLTQEIKFPATFCGIRFSDFINKAPKTLYVDSIYFYKEKLEPLKITRTQKLPFPVTQNTILPPNKVKKFDNSTKLNGNIALFAYKGADTKLKYRLDLEKNFFDGLEVIVGKQQFYPCRNMRVILSNGKEAKISLLNTRFDKNKLVNVWSCKSEKVKTKLKTTTSIKQKSLIISFNELSKTGEIAELNVGRAEGEKSFELIWVPMLSYYWNKTDPHLLRYGKLFAFSHFDWYVSDGSKLTGANQQGKNWAKYNGGVIYNPKTNGLRNPLKERLFINVSPCVNEVFPAIPNPPSPMREVIGHRQWRVKGGTPYSAEVDEARHMRALGMNNVAIRYHEKLWRDTGESYTFKTQAAPKRGGNKALREMITQIQDLGWLAGTYTNYTDFAPVNSFWNEDSVRLTPDGNWYSGWVRCYMPKSSFGRKMEAKLAPQIRAAIGEKHSYCDVLTAVPPWKWVDFDARVPGAATFRAVFEDIGQIALNERIAHKGPAFSEGGCHWFYAGLIDGNYGQIFAPVGFPPEQPLFPNFDLLRIHPLEIDAGMGDPGMFYRGSGNRNYQQFIATTLAYGHIGYLAGSDADKMQMYYMIQPLQKYYIMIPVKSISYECKGQMLDSSAALMDGDWRKGRLRVIYDNDFHVWVNGSRKAWTIDSCIIGKWNLPSWGYMACSADGKVYSVSAQAGTIVDSKLFTQKRKLKISYGPESYYFDSSQNFIHAGNLAGNGAIAMKKEATGWEIIPARGFKEFGFSRKLVTSKNKNIRVVAVDNFGKALGEIKVKKSRDMIWLEPSANPPLTFKYRIEYDEVSFTPAVVCKSLLAPLGKSITLDSAQPIETATWVDTNGQSYDAQIAKRNGNISCLVPESIKAETHLWLKLNVKGQTEWLDFVTVKPLSGNIDIITKDLSKTNTYKCVLSLGNSLGETVKVKIRAKADGRLIGVPDELNILAGQCKKINFSWSAQGNRKLNITVFDKTKNINEELFMEVTSEKIKLNTKNESFESVKNNKPRHWYTNQGIVPFGTVKIGKQSAFDGEKYIELITRDNQTHHLYCDIGKLLPVNANQIVKMSIWGRGKGTLKLGVYGYAGSRMLTSLESPSVKINSNKWEKINFSIKIPDTKYSFKTINGIAIAIIAGKNSNIHLDKFDGYLETELRIKK